MISTLNRTTTLLFVLLTLTPLVAHGIDNPDKPDVVASFKSEAAPYEEQIRAEAETTEEYRDAFSAYESFLRDELERAREQMLKMLHGSQKDAFTKAQRRWKAYESAERAFINRNWNRTDFGSSSVISRGDYRTRLLKNRVITLLYYLQNY